MEYQVKILYVFPDTNVFVQCKQLEALEWRALGNYDKVILIVTRPVISEVDTQKSGSGRLAKRAKIANSLFRRFLQGDLIEISVQGEGPALTVALGQNLEPSDELSDLLNYNHADDRLVGIAHAYQANNDHEVVFLSHDTGPLLMAKRVGIKFHQVPDSWLLNSENDETQKRIKELESDLKRLKDSEPRCSISFNSSEWKFSRIKHRPLTHDQIIELVELLQAAYPLATEFGSTEVNERQGGRNRFGLHPIEKYVPASSEDISRYKENYTKWLNFCREYFEDLHNKLNSQPELFTISASLVNNGGRPADDVSVKFQSVTNNIKLMGLPTNKELEESEVKLQLRASPKVPCGRWVRTTDLTQFGGFNLPSIAPLASYDRLNPNLLNLKSVRDQNAFYWKDGKPEDPSAILEFECAQWRHQDTPEEFHLRVAIAENREPLQGAIQIVVRASNLVDPVRKTQGIEFNIEEVDSFSKAKALITESI
ncbi:PIN domain-containing protein [Pseudomonas sp. GD03696]|uniref:PIN domain-containing protein n=1 Tax=Pseudomonas sp. GD03696 TaxID=2975368 RepID=UPI0024496D60|nr:PIN domain-containing protein [Pseudomonas sp. GD03696]MDH1930485.1 PIN domain-containing protein [Pseudomonas sp. GD03696]